MVIKQLELGLSVQGFSVEGLELRVYGLEFKA